MIDKNAKIFICGHRGMVGSACLRKFQKEGYTNIITRAHAELDLRNQAAVKEFFECEKPEYVILAGAKVGGIMANKHKNTTHYVDYITTWAVEPNKKAPYGAQILFTQMFSDFLKTVAKFIELYATRFGNAISKYRKIGFKSYGGDNYTEIMRIKREEVEKSYNKLQEKFNLTQADSSEDLNLFDILKLKY